MFYSQSVAILDLVCHICSFLAKKLSRLQVEYLIKFMGDKLFCGRSKKTSNDQVKFEAKNINTNFIA